MNFQIVLNVVLLACNVVLIATEGQIEYLISVKTGNQYGAGTDANVYVQFHGINGSSVKNLLSNDCLDNFEQGMTDIFKIKAIDVGPINKVSVEHDNTGSKSAWFFESMRVLKPNAVIYDFSVNKWFKGVRDGHGRVLTSKTVHGTLPSEITIDNKGELRALFNKSNYCPEHDKTNFNGKLSNVMCFFFAFWPMC